MVFWNNLVYFHSFTQVYAMARPLASWTFGPNGVEITIMLILRKFTSLTQTKLVSSFCIIWSTWSQAAKSKVVQSRISFMRTISRPPPDLGDLKQASLDCSSQIPNPNQSYINIVRRHIITDLTITAVSPNKAMLGSFLGPRGPLRILLVSVRPCPSTTKIPSYSVPSISPPPPKPRNRSHSWT